MSASSPPYPSTSLRRRRALTSSAATSTLPHQVTDSGKAASRAPAPSVRPAVTQGCDDNLGPDRSSRHVEASEPDWPRRTQRRTTRVDRRHRLPRQRSRISDSSRPDRARATNRSSTEANRASPTESKRRRRRTELFVDRREASVEHQLEPVSGDDLSCAPGGGASSMSASSTPYSSTSLRRRRALTSSAATSTFPSPVDG